MFKGITFWAILCLSIALIGCSNKPIEPTQGDTDSITVLAKGGGRPFDKVPAFDFSDDFYLQNGINPAVIVDRLVGQDARSVVDDSPHPDFADVRILEITGGFKHNSNLFYYSVNGKAMPNTFTNDAAGQAAMDIANSFRAFIFPKAAGNPLSPAPPNRRHDNVFDDTGGYFSNNPLGLWILKFASWDGPNVNGSACQDFMDDLADDNGTDLDGTPIFKRVGEIEDAEGMGCARVVNRALDGSQGFPWVI
jgi:hypothetical protein